MSWVALPARGAGPSRPRFPCPAPGAAGWLLGLGLVLRLFHYLCNHTIWYDEAVLLANVLGKDYSRLLGPLDYDVAAPPLFLWGLRSLALVFGDHPYVWRFPPFLMSCLVLVVMAALARRVLRPAPAALVIGLVAFSDKFVWLGCNVKPYILDAFLAAGLLYAFARTEGWRQARRILAFGLAAPVLLCLSYPMMFLYAGLLLAFFPVLWRQRRAGPRAAYGGLAAVVLATCAVLYLGPIRAQRIPTLVSQWEHAFPHLAAPASLPGWFVGNNLMVFHYCYMPVGGGCLLAVAAGLWWCYRRRRFDWACVCLGPLAACLVAASLRAYPYRDRLMLFAAPGIGLMTGLGLSVALESGRRKLWVLAGLVIALVLPEGVLSLLRVASPWEQPDAAGSARFVAQRLQPGDLVTTYPGTFDYFFFGRVCPLEQVLRAPGAAGQRLWVLVDAFSISRDRERHEWVRARFAGTGWDLRSELPFHLATVFLYVRRGPDEVRPAGAGMAAKTGRECEGPPDTERGQPRPRTGGTGAGQPASAPTPRSRIVNTGR